MNRRGLVAINDHTGFLASIIFTSIDYMVWNTFVSSWCMFVVGKGAEGRKSVDDLVKFFVCGIIPKDLITEGVQGNSSTRIFWSFNTKFMFLTLENRKRVSIEKLSECCIRFNVSWNPFPSWFVNSFEGIGLFETRSFNSFF